jgi:hypothetical protein
MADLKHIGRIKSTGRKCLIAYRTLPGESDSALVVLADSLTDAQHDSIMSLVESQGAQSAYEFAEVLARSRFPDGSVMLTALHKLGKLSKVPTSTVEVVPNSRTTLGLDALNQLIAEQRGISVNDLALGNSSVATIADVQDLPNDVVVEDTVVTKPIEPLSVEEQAKKYRSEADRLSKEAAQLRRMAEELVPTKKKTTVVET